MYKFFFGILFIILASICYLNKETLFSYQAKIINKNNPSIPTHSLAHLVQDNNILTNEKESLNINKISDDDDDYDDEKYQKAISNIKLVMLMLKKLHVKDLQIEDISKAAIKGMLNLDKYGNYIPKKNKHLLQLDGKFKGIGVKLTSLMTTGGYLLVTEVLENSPAQIAKILEGDIILAIDGEDIKQLEFYQSSAKLRGLKDTEVIVTILRDSKLIDITITRDVIQDTVVRYFLKNNILYLKLNSFQSDTAKTTKQIFNAAITKNIQGIILDLRSNNGGLVQPAIEISNMLLKDGPILESYTENPLSPFPNKMIYAAESELKILNIPIVVLINEYTASAAEILALALQNNSRAVLIGTRTFGKCHIQSLWPLGEDIIKLTVQKYTNFNNKYDLEDDGLIPDIYVQSKTIKHTKQKADVDTQKFSLLRKKLKQHLIQNHSNKQTPMEDYTLKTTHPGIQNIPPENIKNLEKYDNQYQIALYTIKAINVYQTDKNNSSQDQMKKTNFKKSHN